MFQKKEAVSCRTMAACQSNSCKLTAKTWILEEKGKLRGDIGKIKTKTEWGNNNKSDTSSLTSS